MGFEFIFAKSILNLDLMNLDFLNFYIFFVLTPYHFRFFIYLLVMYKANFDFSLIWNDLTDFYFLEYLEKQSPSLNVLYLAYINTNVLNFSNFKYLQFLKVCCLTSHLLNRYIINMTYRIVDFCVSKNFENLSYFFWFWFCSSILMPLHLLYCLLSSLILVSFALSFLFENVSYIYIW